jgi:gliding motility-associated-like protein
MNKIIDKLLIVAFLITAGIPTISARVYFKPNLGQWSQPFDFRAQTGNTALFFTKNSIRVNVVDAHQQRLHDSMVSLPEMPSLPPDQLINTHAYEVTFSGATTKELNGFDKQPFHYNFFLGNDSAKWKSNVSAYTGVSYKQLYSGIDLLFFDNGSQLKYEFTVAPGADPSDIKMNYNGAETRLAKDGRILIHTTVGDIMEEVPYCFQMINGKKTEVPSRLVKTGNTFTYNFPEGYDKKYELVIDPVILYKSYTGNTVEGMTGFGTAYDDQGRMLTMAQAIGIGWPVTLGAAQQQSGSVFATDMAFILFSADGSTVEYATYLGGNIDDRPHSADFNKLHQLVVVGSTGSSDYPTTAGSVMDSNFIVFGRPVFTVFSADGSQLIGSTYFGGQDFFDDFGQGLVIADDTSFYAIGTTHGELPVPIPANAAQTSLGGPSVGFSVRNLFITRINTQCSNVSHLTLYGGNVSEDAIDIIRDSLTGSVVVSGTTSSGIFPGPPIPNTGVINTPQGTTGGTPNGFIVKFNSTLTQIEASASLHRSVNFIDLDNNGKIYAYGLNKADFVPSPNVYSVPTGSAFLMRLNADLNTIELATRLGYNDPAINGFDYKPMALKHSNCNTFYILASAKQLHMDTVNNLPNPQGGLYVAEIGPDFSSLIFGSYIGGNVADQPARLTKLRFDPAGKLYINAAVIGAQNNWWGTPGAWAPTRTSADNDAGAMVLLMDHLPAGGFTLLPDDTLCLGTAINLQSQASQQANIRWDLGDGTIVNNMTQVTHNYTAPGRYKILYEASDSSSICPSFSKDSAFVVIAAPDSNISVFPQDTLICGPEGLLNVNVMGGVSYQWSPAALVSDPTSANVTVLNLGVNNLNVTVTDAAGCKHEFAVNVEQQHIFVDAGPDKFIRIGEETILEGRNSVGTDLKWRDNPTLSSLTSLTPSVKTNSTQWYYIVAKAGSCEATDSAKVTVLNFFLPNAFSPNGDGLNDLYRVENTDIINIHASLSIYNRFGERVYQTDDISKGWDGTYKGKNCDLGVYFYSAKVRIGDTEETFKGDITLIR